jgi:hypothetical protein
MFDANVTLPARIYPGTPHFKKMGVVEKFLDRQARSLQPLSQVCVACKKIASQPDLYQRYGGL